MTSVSRGIHGIQAMALLIEEEEAAALFLRRQVAGRWGGSKRPIKQEKKPWVRKDRAVQTFVLQLFYCLCLQLSVRGEGFAAQQSVP